MRISDSMIADLALQGLEASRKELFQASRVASSGVRVEKPSDDPVAAARSRGLRSIERRAEAVAAASAEGIDRLHAVDSVLAQAAELVERSREVAVQGANDTLSADERMNLADEVRSIRQQLLSLANTRIDGEAVFGGLRRDSDPFDPAGAYVGSPELAELEVGPGLRLRTQVSGAEIFGAAGGQNAFEALNRLESSLRADDPAEIAARLPELAAVTSQVATGRAASGVGQLGLTQALNVAQRSRDQATFDRAALVEASPFDAFTDLVRAETALRQALAVASRLPPPSMIDVGG